jgi:hypothetical protein
MPAKSLLLVCSLMSLLALAACGGGDGGGSLVTTVSQGGIWSGTDSATGLQVKGIVDESGQFHFIRSDLAQFVGTASTTGNSLSANFEGFSQLGTTFDDGSTHGTGTLSGAVSERSSLALTYDRRRRRQQRHAEPLVQHAVRPGLVPVGDQRQLHGRELQ